MLTALAIVGVVVAVIWNALFVTAEYSLVSARRGHLDELAEHGDPRARRAIELLDEPFAFFSAVQLGVSVSSLGLGAIGTPLVAGALEGPVGGWMRDSLAALISILVAFILMTTVHVVLGEVVPRTFGLARSERAALALTPALSFFTHLARPWLALLGGLARSTAAGIGLRLEHGLALVHTEDDLKLMVSHSTDEGVLERDEHEMLTNVFDFADTEVDEVMVPRPDIVALPLSLTPTEALNAIFDQPFTRYPVYGEDLDDIRGILHLRRLIVAVQNGGRDRPDLTEILQPATRVPETKRLGVLLAELRRSKAHMAIVFDEYGSTAGVVTLEDLLEEIVGEIADEFDRPEGGVLRLARDQIRIEGSFPIFEFNERFRLELPSEDYNTVGGFVFGELGREPQPGDSVEAMGFRFLVHDTDGPRITSLDVDLRSGSSAEPSPK